MSNIEEKVTAFLGRYMDIEKLEQDTNYIKTGLVSSLFAMQLVMYLEREFSIIVENEDIDPANFSTINAVVQFIERKSAVTV